MAVTVGLARFRSGANRKEMAALAGKVVEWTGVVSTRRGSIERERLFTKRQVVTGTGKAVRERLAAGSRPLESAFDREDGKSPCRLLILTSELPNSVPPIPLAIIQ